jgi:hypothetical protein
MGQCIDQFREEVVTVGIGAVEDNGSEKAM